MRRALTCLALCAATLVSCGSQRPAPVAETSSARKLEKAGPKALEKHRRGRTYVAAYSSIYWGADSDMAVAVVNLGVTLSVRNTSTSHPVILESVRYFDSEGKMVREHLAAPSVLPAMASAEYVILRQDRAGGPGANFLVDWAVPQDDAEDPFIEAVMVGQHGSAGISFTSPGRATRR